jgi:hypothetical protein
MTQTGPIRSIHTSTDPGDIRTEYERTEQYGDDALDLLVGMPFEDLPEFLQRSIRTWYADTPECLSVISQRVDEARKG